MPRPKSIHSPVPVNPVWPIVSVEQPSPPAQPGCHASHPSVRVGVARVRIAMIADGVSASPDRQRLGVIQHAIRGAEQARMPRSLEGERVLVMHLADQQPGRAMCNARWPRNSREPGRS